MYFNLFGKDTITSLAENWFLGWLSSHAGFSPHSYGAFRQSSTCWTEVWFQRSLGMENFNPAVSIRMTFGITHDGG